MAQAFAVGQCGAVYGLPNSLALEDGVMASGYNVAPWIRHALLCEFTDAQQCKDRWNGVQYRQSTEKADILRTSFV